MKSTESRIPPYPAWFRLPSSTTVAGRSTSITNAFIAAITPVVRPTHADLAEALSILGMTEATVCCAYCGGDATEWDHLYPLVRARQPTGFITEIQNLIPACGKCNQSKGSRDWHVWMTGTAKLAPAARGIPDLVDRVLAIRRYDAWRPKTRLDHSTGAEATLWAEYWKRRDDILELLREADILAKELRIATEGT